MSELKTTAQQLIEVYKRVNNESDFVAVVTFEGICFDRGTKGDELAASEQWHLINEAWDESK